MVFGIIVGIVLAAGLGLLIVAIILDKSNNFGDSTADLQEMTNGGVIYLKKERCSRNTGVDYLKLEDFGK